MYINSRFTYLLTHLQVLDWLAVSVCNVAVISELYRCIILFFTVYHWLWLNAM